MANPLIGCAIQLKPEVVTEPGEARAGVIVDIIQGGHVPMYFLVLINTGCFELWIHEGCMLTDTQGFQRKLNGFS